MEFLQTFSIVLWWTPSLTSNYKFHNNYVSNVGIVTYAMKGNAKNCNMTNGEII